MLVYQRVSVSHLFVPEVPRKLLGAASGLHIEAWTCHVVAFSWSLLAALQSLVLICRGYTEYLMMQQFTDCNLTFLVNMAHRYSTMLHEVPINFFAAGANGHDMSKIIGIRHTPKIGIPNMCEHRDSPKMASFDDEITIPKYPHQ